MDFYTRVVGLSPVRFDEFAAGEAPFPSVRVCKDSIIDLSPVDNIAGTESLTGSGGGKGKGGAGAGEGGGLDLDSFGAGDGSGVPADPATAS